MADKFRRTFPIPITFADGEEVDPGKVDSIASQSRNGLGLVEKAVGDIWNQSGDGTLVPTGNLFKNALYISNIGRTLGQQHLISPRIPSLPGITEYADTITNSPAKQISQLKYKPVPAGGSLAGTDFTIGTTVPGGALTTFKTSPDLVQVAGDYHVTANGKLFTFTPLTSVVLSYKPSLVPEIDGIASFVAIPDPNTDVSVNSNFMGLKLAYKNNTDNTQGYWLYLPPRRPLVASRKITNSPNNSGNEVDPAAPPIGGKKYFWQLSTVNASTDAHYRYTFPNEIQTVINAAVVETLLPDNFIYLVDTTTGTIVEGLTFSADPAAPKYVVKVVGTALDAIVAATPSLVSLQATETTAAYNSRWVLIGPGDSLSRAVSGSIANYSAHSHTGADGTLAVSHSSLVDLYNDNAHNWSTSAWLSDDHPQYLHRDGYNTGTRDIYKNGLLGDLLLLSTSSTSNYFNTSADSNKLLFGDATHAALYYKQATPAVTLINADFDINTTAAKLKFEASSTAYVDKTRADQYYNQISTTRSLSSAIAGAQTVSSNTVAKVIGTITLTNPTVFTTGSGVHLWATITWHAAAANKSAQFRWRVHGGLLIGSTTVTDTDPVGNGTNLVTTSCIAYNPPVTGTITYDLEMLSLDNATVITCDVGNIVYLMTFYP